MYARRKPKKKSEIHSRIKAMSDQAAAKGEKQYQADLAAAKSQEASASKPQSIQRNVDKNVNWGNVHKENFRRAAVKATPSKDVQVRKSSGMYNGAMPVGGTSSKKLYAKRNPIKGIRRSDAKKSVRKSMIRQMQG